VILEARIVDPIRLSQGEAIFHGYFQSSQPILGGEAGSFWTWEIRFPSGADESPYLIIMDTAYQELYGCFSKGRGRMGVGRATVDAEFTATVNREDGTFKASIPTLCVSEAGARVSPAWIRASFNFYPSGGRYDYGFGRAYFTDRLYPGDVAIQRR
jgi:hypothetical protein